MDQPIVFCLVVGLLLSTIATSQRIQLTDSILDVINTRNVEKLLAQQRRSTANVSKNSKRFIIPNDHLDEKAGADDTPDAAYQTPPEVINFDFNSRRQPLQIREDIVMQYNETVPYSPISVSPLNVMPDMQAYRGDKILKSSRNALYVTRKEYLKKDWCKTEPLIQRIREDGCLSRTIVNRFCYGQCNSFYIPKGPKGPKRRRSNNSYKNNEYFEDEDLTGPAFRSCAFCKPKKFAWVTITLRCPALVPQIRRKRIQRIKQCRCMAEPLN